MEECEDGNVLDYDRCSSMCKIELPDVCPGTAVPIAKGQTIIITDTTIGADDTFTDAANKGNCNPNNYPGADLVYAVTPTANGMLTATIDADYGNAYVHARTSCPGNTGNEIACQYINGPGTVSTKFGVNANSTYYVVVDSWQSKSGGFTLTLTLP